MQEQEVGKELILTPPPDGTVARQRSKPTLVKVGESNRLVSSDGLFHSWLAADYLIEHARKEWVPVAELSKVFCGANTIDGKKRVRRSMFSVFTELLNRGEFLVYETIGPFGRINAVKLLDVNSEMERQAALPQVERMKQRRQLSAAKYEKALEVIRLHEAL